MEKTQDAYMHDCKYALRLTERSRGEGKKQCGGDAVRQNGKNKLMDLPKMGSFIHGNGESTRALFL